MHAAVNPTPGANPAVCNTYQIPTAQEPTLSSWLCLAFPGPLLAPDFKRAQSLVIWTHNASHETGLAGNLDSMTWSPNINDNSRMPCRQAHTPCMCESVCVCGGGGGGVGGRGGSEAAAVRHTLLFGQAPPKGHTHET